MKKILSLVVVVAALAMVGCCGNNNKKAATCEKAACEQCVEAAEAAATPCQAECAEKAAD